MTLQEKKEYDERLARYAEQERSSVIKFFTEYKEKLPDLGCEKIVDQQKFIATSLERLKQHHTSKDFIAVIRRLKAIKKHIENERI